MSLSPLELDPSARETLWKTVTRAIEGYLRDLPDLRVSPSPNPEIPRRLLSDVDFEKPLAVDEAMALVVEGLRHHQVHNGHPRYFGLFNPATSAWSIAADALVAAFNPQLAAWSHAPFACEVEQLLVRALGSSFGYRTEEFGGSFTMGGAEANHTALLLALAQRFPTYADDGARSLPGLPAVYVSSESHHSFLKAARLTGLGSAAIRQVAVGEGFIMDPGALEEAIREDRAAGLIPFFVVATLGTTGAGLVDPVAAIADVGRREKLWVHADAAWGGAAALLPELRSHFEGVELSDSITFDAHKWLSVPMAAGMFFTRHPELLEATFAVDAGYMPRSFSSVVEPHRSSMQWTRRFIGLKLFLPLLVVGFPGYQETIRNMVRLGSELRRRLASDRWRVVNRTPLPVVCFQDESRPDGDTLAYLRAVADRVVSSGGAWISITSVGGRHPALRACISSFRTSDAELDALLDLLSEARAAA